MAITAGLEVSCANLQAVGGIRNICLRSWTSGDVITYTNSAVLHGISGLDDGSATATWYMFEFKQETPTLNVTATRENGSTSFECSLSFTVPQMDTIRYANFMDMLDTCMMAIAVGNDGTKYVIGASEKYSNVSAASRSQTFCSLTGLEGTTGVAYNDDNTQVATISCKQWELPRVYSGTLSLYSATSTATTS